jgi:hypothetical protein
MNGIPCYSFYFKIFVSSPPDTGDSFLKKAGGICNITKNSHFPEKIDLFQHLFLLQRPLSASFFFQEFGFLLQLAPMIYNQKNLEKERQKKTSHTLSRSLEVSS